MATPRSGYKEHSAHCALFTPIPTTGLDFPLREAIRNRFVAEGTVEQFTSAGQLALSTISSYLVVALLLQFRHGSLFLLMQIRGHADVAKVMPQSIGIALR